MDIVTIACTALITSIVGGLVSSGFSGGRKLKAEMEERHKRDDAVDQAFRALLWRELQTFHTLAMEQNGLTISQRRHLESVYQAYHDLGGNGTGTRLFEEAMATRIIDED